MKKIAASLAIAALAGGAGLTAGAATAATAPLMAGVSRIDITPAPADLPAPFKTIESRLYVRTVVLDSQGKRAVIVVADVPTIAKTVYDDLKKQIAETAGTSPDNVMFAVTHTHNAVRLDTNPVGIILPGSAKITGDTLQIILTSVKQAIANVQPAQAGYAKGETNLLADPGDVRRKRMDASGPDPIDRGLGVFEVEDLSGQPIAFVVNANIEPVVAMATPNEVSADVAGATERYVEQRYGDKPVVLYTVGSARDLPYDARPRGAVPAADAHALVSAVGTILGEEVLQTSKTIKPTQALDIFGASDTLWCPGKITAPLNCPRDADNQPTACTFTDKDGDKVALNVGVLKLGDLKIIQSDANITPKVWDRFQKLAPGETDLAALYYGPMHYVVEDADYPSHPYRANAAMAKPGCAAQGFIDTALKLVAEANKAGA